MEIQNQIVKVLNALNEIEEPVTRQQLAEFMVGKKKSETILQYMDLKTFGSGKDEAESFWKAMLEKGVQMGLAKAKPAKSHTLAITPAGKKFRKHPEVVEVNIENYHGDDEVTMMLITLMRERKSRTELDGVSSEHTRLQIKIIKAIDRKISLDDLAEQEKVGLDTVFDELERMRKGGRVFDIRYFVDEVIAPEDTQEILDWFEDNDDDWDGCLEEWGDVYKEEELRLLHYLYQANKK